MTSNLQKLYKKLFLKKIYVVVSIGNNEIKSKISTIENVISVAPTKLKSKFLFNELDLDKIQLYLYLEKMFYRIIY